MAEAGVLIGLMAFNLVQFVASQAPASGVPVTPAVFDAPAAPIPKAWVESARSRELLRGQEGAPAPVSAAAYRSEVPDTRIVSTAAVRVIDGDTFIHGGERIRIADIDTPEVRGQCAQERAMAAQATRRLRALLAEGPFDLVRQGRDEDRYGRKLRVVMRGGRSIGDMLVSEGLARTWSGRRQPWC